MTLQGPCCPELCPQPAPEAVEAGPSSLGTWLSVLHCPGQGYLTALACESLLGRPICLLSLFVVRDHPFPGRAPPAAALTAFLFL